MTRLACLLALPLLSVAGCASKPPPPPMVASSAINDCALLSVIGREHLKLSSAQATRVKLNGEDLAWTPGCDWRVLGFNMVEQKGAAIPENAGTLALVEFHRPKYDAQGALVRVSVTPGPGKELCRVQPVEGGEGWRVSECKPDPKVGVAATMPSPADVTPESGVDRTRNPTAAEPPVAGSGGVESRDTRADPR